MTQGEVRSCNHEAPTGENGRLSLTLVDRAHEEIDQRLDDFWQNEGSSLYLNSRHAPMRRELVKRRERAFATQLIGTVLKIADAHSGNIALMFDVDETIATKRALAEEKERFTRPSLDIVIGILEETLGERLEIGILSTRGQASLDTEKQNPTYLKDIIGRVNPAYVISSRDGAMALSFKDTLGHSQLKKDERETIRSFVDPQVVETDFRGSFDIGSHGIKPFVLKELVDSHPDTYFVAVDDHEWVKEINPEYPRVKGVHLDDESSFFL